MRPDVDVNEIRAVIGEMRKRESSLWNALGPHIGVFAAAVMLDGFASRLEIAVGDAPRPRYSRAGEDAGDQDKEGGAE